MSKSFKDKVERLLQLALALTSQEWTVLGLDEDDDVNPLTQPTSDMGILVERITSLLLVRCIVLVTWYKSQSNQSTQYQQQLHKQPLQQPQQQQQQQQYTFKDLSTSTVCQQILSEDFRYNDNQDNSLDQNGTQTANMTLYPYETLTETVVKELQEYVRRILEKYRDVPYHNRSHAFHVVLSVNKLVDMMISGKNRLDTKTRTNLKRNEYNKSNNYSSSPSYSANNTAPQNQTMSKNNGHLNASTPGQPSQTTSTSVCSTQLNTSGSTSLYRNHHPNHNPVVVTYGLRHDPLALFSLLFAALIHDVEHYGIPNRQLALEDDRLAVLYNDQSMAENWSLYVAFSDFLSPDFQSLRRVLFHANSVGSNSTEYRRFRRIVIDLVLSTDIASPERTQINKSKWKEAFGDPYETIERKMMKHHAYAHPTNATTPTMNGGPYNSINFGVHPIDFNLSRHSLSARRFSLTGHNILAPRRASNLSTVSAVSFNGNPVASADVGCAGDSHTDRTQDEDVDDDDENSFSETPEGSDSECGMGENGPSRRSSPVKVGGTPSTLQSTTMNESAYGPTTSAPFERRSSIASTNTTGTARYRQRLGILRTVDLSGETIETYSRRGSIQSSNIPGSVHSSLSASMNVVLNGTGAAALSTGQINGGAGAGVRWGKNNPQSTMADRCEEFKRQQRHQNPVLNNNDLIHGASGSNTHNTATTAKVMSPATISPEIAHAYDADEPDELKAIVVLETILTAADVAHNLQGWDHMVKWSRHLYLELRKAYVTRRTITPDPSDRWFENQIGFLESYLLPLARRLEDTGVFDERSLGMFMFSSIVESNRDKWLTDGYDVAKQSIEDGNILYPINPIPAEGTAGIDATTTL